MLTACYRCHGLRVKMKPLSASKMKDKIDQIKSFIFMHLMMFSFS